MYFKLIYVAGNCLNDNSFIKDTFFILLNIFIPRPIQYTEDKNSCIQNRIPYLIMVKYASTYEILTTNNILASIPFTTSKAKTNLLKYRCIDKIPGDRTIDCSYHL